MSKRRPNTVFVIRDDEHRELGHVIARHKKGALAVAKTHGIDGDYALEDIPSMASRAVNFKKVEA